MSAVEHHDIVVVGTGFAGLGMAIELERHGYRDFVVLERAAEVGGTWRANHYPGCACDVPTALYSFSFAPNPEWSHFFSRHEEIRDYMRDCAIDFGVQERIRFGADLLASKWDDEAQLWRLRLADGSELSARVVIGGFGGLSEPADPDVPGLDSFAGPRMHSADWDHAVDLDGKRIGVIGTGASAIQIVPQIAKRAGRVDVYQRTPAWIFPKLDRRFSRLEKWVFRRFPIAQRALRGSVFAFGEAVGFGIFKRPGALRLLEAIGNVHRRLQVRDPEVRRKLTPGYRAGCKRMLVSSDFYPAFNRDNVDLVTDAIERVEPEGIRTATGELRELDVLVCATGFDLPAALSRVAATGRDGLTLAEAWADGFKAHKGTMISGFPNLMLLSGPNSGTGSTSQVFMIEAQIAYVLAALRAMRERGAAVVEPTAEAQAAYNEWIDGRMGSTVWLTGCDSWYLDESGRSPVLYPDYSSLYRRRLREFDLGEHTLTAPHPARDDPRLPVAI